MHKNMNINIRLATSDDYEAIAKLSVATWQESYQSVFPSDLLDSLSWKQRALDRKTFFNDPQRNSLVAELEQRLVGFGDFGPARTEENISDIDSSFAELYAIYMLDKYKGHGIGKLIFSEIQKHLTKQGFKNLIVWTLANNDLAIKFYQNIGFNKTTWHKQTKVGDIYYTEIALFKFNE